MQVMRSMMIFNSIDEGQTDYNHGVSEEDVTILKSYLCWDMRSKMLDYCVEDMLRHCTVRAVFRPGTALLRPL